MTEALLEKLADHGATALLLGITLLVLVPMILKLSDRASRNYREEMQAERQAHREETQLWLAEVRDIKNATNHQTVVITSELKRQTGVLLRISESGDLPQMRVERHAPFDDRRDPPPTPTPKFRTLEPDEGDRKK